MPHFNVLRAEVAVANERPALIQARNNYRIAKNNLSNLLGYNLPRDIWEDIPLNLTDKLDAAPYQIDLPQAIEQALANRTELAALRKTEELQRENVVNARSGYKPTVQVFAGYNWYNAQYTPPVDLDHDIHGWNAGAELSWDIFDGMLTRGKVVQARALYEKSKTDVEDMGRQIELEVRTAYSHFIEAREVLDSQKTVQAEAEEALREAEARATAGTGTQLDVLDAQTSLTQARTTEIQALHDYDAARARLERAIGADMGQTHESGILICRLTALAALGDFVRGYGKNSTGIAFRFRQNRSGSVRTNSRGGRRRTDFHRRHGQGAARGRPGGERHQRTHRLSRNARWPRQNAASKSPRRPAFHPRQRQRTRPPCRSTAFRRLISWW